MTLGLMTDRIMTLSIMGFIAPLSINDTQHNVGFVMTLRVNYPQITT